MQNSSGANTRLHGVRARVRGDLVGGRRKKKRHTCSYASTRRYVRRALAGSSREGLSILPDEFKWWRHNDTKKSAFLSTPETLMVLNIRSVCRGAVPPATRWAYSD